MSETYFIINRDSKTIEHYTSISLFNTFKQKGLCSMDEIKEVGNIDFLLTRLVSEGFQLFKTKELTSAKIFKILMKNKNQEIEFESISAAIRYCKEQKLSSAADSYIRTALVKALKGQTKSAYGRTWQFTFQEVDLEDYTHRIII